VIDLALRKGAYWLALRYPPVDIPVSQ